MTRAQRIVAVVYCLLVVYCGAWVPWHYDMAEIKGIKEGYAPVWSGPPGGLGSPDIAAIISRIIAASGLGGAAFLIAGKWTGDK
jgi:hypothetical protein